MSAGIQLENLDTTTVAGNDFYRFACGGWIQAHPLSDEYARYGSFDELAEKNRVQIKDLIDQIVAADNLPNTDAGKIAAIYKMVMDVDRRNKDGLAPLMLILERIASVTERSEVFPMMASLVADGIAGGFFVMHIDADLMNSRMNLVSINQGGLSLQQKEYYTDTDNATTAIREAFCDHVVRMFTLCGFDHQTAEKKMAGVMNIETRIAIQSYNAVKQRDIGANYHKMSYESLKADFSGIDWDTFFTYMGMEGVEEVDVSQPEPIHEVENVLMQVPVDDLVAYLQWQVIDSAATHLTTEMDAAHFDFYGRVMSGTKEQRPMWKRATAFVSGIMGEAIGRLYVQKYFPSQAKERMVQMIENLKVAMGQRIDSQQWMSDTTKASAHEKLKAFHVKVGYPDTWKNYDALVIDSSKTLLDNAITIFRWLSQDMIQRKFKKPVDNTEWHMAPQTVNAYYNPTTNEICFPAGILQYPFFEMAADDAFNYGAIGVVIGHEMTHGFDDQGRQFDKEGNLADWWDPFDAERFKERVQVLVNYFNHIEVLPGLFANGELTLGENIADHGGLMVAYQAFRNATKDAPLKDELGFTPEQRFFMAYASVWGGSIRSEEIRKRTKSDPHSLGRWRVNGTLPHIDAWYEAFQVTPKDSLYLAPEKRAEIW